MQPFVGATLWAEAHGRRQAVQLGVEPEAIVELPPRPPAGVFDLRVRVGRGHGAWQVPLAHGSRDYTLTVQGPELIVGWEVPAGQDPRWELIAGDRTLSLVGNGTLALGTQADPVELVLRQAGRLPAHVSLAQNYPNPFNAGTVIAYDLAEPGQVSLGVYDLAGQRVRLLVAGPRPAGRHQERWDGRDDTGAPVASGLYLYQLQVGGDRSIRKMLLLK
jgi:hypothetical protein